MKVWTTGLGVLPFSVTSQTGHGLTARSTGKTLIVSMVEGRGLGIRWRFC